MRKDLPSADMLRQLYWEDNLSLIEIAARYQTDRKLIRRRMDAAGIDRRGPGRPKKHEQMPEPASAAPPTPHASPPPEIGGYTWIQHRPTVWILQPPGMRPGSGKRIADVYEDRPGKWHMTVYLRSGGCDGRASSEEAAMHMVETVLHDRLHDAFIAWVD